MPKDPTKPDPIPSPLHRLLIESEVSGLPLHIEHNRDGKFVFWEDVADLVVEVSGLIARIEMAHDLHAVFTIKDSKEFSEVKHLLSEVFKEKE